MSSVWKGHLSFGLVTIPVKLYAGARPDRVSFNQLHEPCMSRIKQHINCPTCDRNVERNEIVKGYEVEKNRFVAVTAEELDEFAPESSRLMAVARFVPADQIDPLLFESSYYLCPDNNGDKGYALLHAALSERSVYAIATVSMHGKEHVIAIRALGRVLMAHTLYYESELRADNGVDADRSLVNPQELTLARKLIQVMTGAFNHAQYADAYKPQVERLIEAKLTGKKQKPSKVAEIRHPSTLTDQLEATLKAMTVAETAQPKPAARSARAKRQIA